MTKWQFLSQLIYPLPHIFPGGFLLRKIASIRKFLEFGKRIAFPGHIWLWGFRVMGQHNFCITDSDAVNYPVALAYPFITQCFAPFKFVLEKRLCGRMLRGQPGGIVIWKSLRPA